MLKARKSRFSDETYKPHRKTQTYVFRKRVIAVLAFTQFVVRVLRRTDGWSLSISGIPQLLGLSRGAARSISDISLFTDRFDWHAFPVGATLAFHRCFCQECGKNMLFRAGTMAAFSFPLSQTLARVCKSRRNLLHVVMTYCRYHTCIHALVEHELLRVQKLLSSLWKDSMRAMNTPLVSCSSLSTFTSSQRKREVHRLAIATENSFASLLARIQYHDVLLSNG